VTAAVNAAPSRRENGASTAANTTTRAARYDLLMATDEVCSNARHIILVTPALAIAPMTATYCAQLGGPQLHSPSVRSKRGHRASTHASCLPRPSARRGRPFLRA
jgi:hypothetical protein